MSKKAAKRILSKTKHAKVSQNQSDITKELCREIRENREKKTNSNGKKLCNEQVVAKKPISRFKPGQSGNPNGRPKGSKNKFSIAELSQAIKDVEKYLSTKKERVTFMKAWILAAWGDASAMSNIANYMLPKLKSIEQVNLNADLMGETERASLWAEYNKKRFDF